MKRKNVLLTVNDQFLLNKIKEVLPHQEWKFIHCNNIPESVKIIINQKIQLLIWQTGSFSFWQIHGPKILKVSDLLEKVLVIYRDKEFPATKLDHESVEFLRASKIHLINTHTEKRDLKDVMEEILEGKEENKMLKKDKKINILLADDADFNREIVKDSLADFNCRIYEAKDGIEAIEKLDQVEFDLVLLDYSMPKMDGLGVLKHLREELKRDHVPVLMISAQQDMETVKDLVRFNIKGYIVKPINVDTLLEKMNAIVPLKKQPTIRPPETEN